MHCMQVHQMRRRILQKVSFSDINSNNVSTYGSHHTPLHEDVQFVNTHTWSTTIADSYHNDIEIPKRRNSLPDDAIRFLKIWLYDHRYYAYPTVFEKLLLADKTNLTSKQITNWFINARRRLLPDMLTQEGCDPDSFIIRHQARSEKTRKLIINKPKFENAADSYPTDEWRQEQEQQPQQKNKTEEHLIMTNDETRKRDPGEHKADNNDGDGDRVKEIVESESIEQEYVSFECCPIPHPLDDYIYNIEIPNEFEGEGAGIIVGAEVTVGTTIAFNDCMYNFEYNNSSSNLCKKLDFMKNL